MVVLARTDPRPGPRSLSLLLVEKPRISTAAFRHVPRVRTLGIRGADISGIVFDHAELPAEALIGAAGTGLETVLRVIQLTRLLCAGFSLGVGDTALRCTLDFVFERRLYGGSAFDIPTVRWPLVHAFADLMLAEGAAIAGARLAHVAPEQLSVAAAVVKFFVPTTVEALIHDVGVVLGARCYLRDDHWHGIFQKVARDAAVVSFFDGSTAVNLQALGLQLRGLAAGAIDRQPPAAQVEGLFRLTEAVLPLRTDRLALSARGHDLVVQSLRHSAERLKRLGDAGVSCDVAIALARQTSHLLEEVGGLLAAVTRLEAEQGIQLGRSVGLFALARRYCSIFVAAACLGLWLHNRESLEPCLRGGEWLVVCLSRTVPAALEPLDDHVTGAARAMETLFRRRRLFSIVPFQLAGDINDPSASAPSFR
jgi:hypothetical protein